MEEKSAKFTYTGVTSMITCNPQLLALLFSYRPPDALHWCDQCGTGATRDLRDQTESGSIRYDEDPEDRVIGGKRGLPRSARKGKRSSASVQPPGTPHHTSLFSRWLRFFLRFLRLRASALPPPAPPLLRPRSTRRGQSSSARRQRNDALARYDADDATNAER